MSRINKFVLTVSLLIFIMISAVACGIYTQMVKERVYSLKQSVIDTAFAVANIAEYRRSVAIDLINTLNPTEEQLLVGLRTAYADSVSPSYLYDVGPYLISSDECIQVKEFEKNYCADIMQVVKYRHVKNTGFISFDGKTFVYYLYPVTHNRSLIFLLGLERFSLLSKSLAMDSENLMFSLFKNGKPVTGDEYNAKNAIFTVSEAMEHFAYLPTGLYVFAYKKDVYLRVCTLIIFFAALVAVISGTSCLYLVRRVINRGIVEKEDAGRRHGGILFRCWRRGTRVLDEQPVPERLAGGRLPRRRSGTACRAAARRGADDGGLLLSCRANAGAGRNDASAHLRGHACFPEI